MRRQPRRAASSTTRTHSGTGDVARVEDHVPTSHQFHDFGKGIGERTRFRDRQARLHIRRTSPFRFGDHLRVMTGERDEACACARSVSHVEGGFHHPGREAAHVGLEDDAAEDIDAQVAELSHREGRETRAVGKDIHQPEALHARRRRLSRRVEGGRGAVVDVRAAVDVGIDRALQPLHAGDGMIVHESGAPGAHISPIFCCGRQSACRSGTYSLKPLRQRVSASVSYAFSVSRSVRLTTTSILTPSRRKSVKYTYWRSSKIDPSIMV